jgi:hypothetical protein
MAAAKSSEAPLTEAAASEALPTEAAAAEVSPTKAAAAEMPSPETTAIESASVALSRRAKRERGNYDTGGCEYGELSDHSLSPQM